jgi:hypothetical protein
MNRILSKKGPDFKDLESMKISKSHLILLAASQNKRKLIS